MEQHFAICRVAVAPLRTEPSDKAEISTQLLFGDHVEILQQTEKWWQVRNAADEYIGWSDFKQFSKITLEQYLANHNSRYLAPASLQNTIQAEDGSLYHLSPGSSLPLYDSGCCYLGDQKFQVMFQPRILQEDGTPAKASDIIKDAQFFLNASYLWGGKNLFGIDCSGLVQIAYRLNGIQLKRDAWQQAEQGTAVASLSEAQTSDVAFFTNDEGRVIHVGILLDQDRIIHASGKVRTDQIDQEGIYNQELGRYTHKLSDIKRYL
ncbi:C40 family peptidase [Pedobacter deserti]|uniref:C40 family peptidase n=1 Tax=Pedobacter deserti TaxID=2817382 RepID=UPI00210BFEDA|nr:C40 family peptidase [Pedobacter sp. SYSU D00382]